MAGEKIGGVSADILRDIAQSVDGEVKKDCLVFGKGEDSHIIAITRLGVSETPDPLGTVTTTTRFKTPKEGIDHLDATAAKVKKG